MSDGQTAGKRLTVYVDTGSNGYPYKFSGGPVADRYPGLLHVFSDPLPGLVEAVLILPAPDQADDPK